MKLLTRLWLNVWMNMLCPHFFGIGMGPDQREFQEYGATANIGNFGTSKGEKAINTASNFWEDIVSGDQTKIAKALGPEFSAINKRGQQQQKTASEFGNRSGGTNAYENASGDTIRAEADTLTGQLAGGAAGQLGSMGEGLLGIGLSGHEAAFGMAKTIHDQKAAKLGDIFHSIASVASSVATMGFGGAAGKAFGSMTSGQISGAFGGPTSVPTTTSNASSDFIQ
jgi:hypothetical protein